MAGPHSMDDLEHEIYLSVVSSNSREGQPFPVKYVWLNMQRDGYTKDDFSNAAESLKSKGLITDDEKISKNFFDILGSA